MTVFRRKRKLNGKVVLSLTWYGEYRHPVTGKRQRVNLKLRHKEAAMEKLRQIVSRLEKEAVGFRPPVAQEASMSKPIMEHVEDYTRQLASEKCSKMHVYNCRNYLRIIFRDCSWKTVRDANLDGYCGWRTKQTTKAAKTLHEYQTTLKAFFDWLKRMRRIEFNPFEDLENVRRDGRKARIRRALPLDDFQRLLNVVGEHQLVYFVVGNTGMRRGDAVALTWGDLHLESEKPMWRSRAENAKNREGTLTDLHLAARDALLQARPSDWKPSDKVFGKNGVPSIYMHRQYLKQAGIPYKTQDGQADFHALRMMYGSYLHDNEVPLICAAQYMRHKDWRQTASTYNDPQRLHLAEKLAGLPSLGKFNKGTEKGTKAIGFYGQSSTLTENNGPLEHPAQVIEMQKHEPTLSATGTDGPLSQNGCPTRIRT